MAGSKRFIQVKKRFGLMVEISVLKEFQATIISAATVWSQPIVWTPRPPASQTCLSIHRCKPVDLEARTIEVKKLVRFRESQGRCRGHMASKRLTAWKFSVANLEDLDLAPGASTQLKIPTRAFKPEPQVEYFLELTFNLKRDFNWGKAGHEVAWDEFKLPDFSSIPAAKVKLRAPTIRQEYPTLENQSQDSEAKWPSPDVMDKMPALTVRPRGAVAGEAPLAQDLRLAGKDFEIIFDKGRNHEVVAVPGNRISPDPFAPRLLARPDRQ